MDENNTSPIVTRRRKKWLRIAAYVALPLFGIAIGSGATMCFMRSAMKKAFSMSSDELAYKVTAGLASRYDLDVSRKSTVHATAKTHIGNMIQIRDEVQPRVYAELQAFREEVGEVLTSEQRQRWDGNFAWMLSRWPFPANVAERSQP